MPPDGHRSEGTPSLSEVPYAGAKPFAYFSAFGKVSRCKSETASRRYRRNGYVHKKIRRLTRSLREQVESSHRRSHRVQFLPGSGRVVVSAIAFNVPRFCVLRHVAGGMPNWLMNQRVKELAME
jgi:hypothetical protein